MDNVTHSLFALTLARTPLGRAGRGTTAALVIASNAPDLDIVSTLQGGTAAYLRWHRGPTHGALGVLGLGLLAAAVVWGAGRLGRNDKGDEPRATLPMLAAISMLGVLLHVAMDLPTSYGTRLLSPFDWHWFALDWLPIADPYLLIVLGAALAFGRTSAAASRRNATVALGLMALNYGVRGVAHHEALRLAPRLFGPTLPQRCAPPDVRPPLVDSWPRAMAPRATDPPDRRCLVELAAIPTFLSPFHWQVVAHLSNAYEIHQIDLTDARLRSESPASGALWRTAVHVPNVWTFAVDKAATSPTAQIFLGFSRFPAARAFVDPAGVATVRWTDIRFTDWAASQRSRRTAPFALTVRIGADGGLEERFGR